MSRYCLFAVTVMLALAMTGTAEAATDLFGDPLPEGAVQRLGSERLRYGGIADLAYLPDGRAVVASGVSIDIWDMSVGEMEASHRIGPRGLTAIDISRDGGAMVAADNAGNIYEWDFEAAEVVREWATGQRSLASVCYSTDETRVLTCGAKPAHHQGVGSSDRRGARVHHQRSCTTARQAVYGPGDLTAIHPRRRRLRSGRRALRSAATEASCARSCRITTRTQRSIALSPDGERLLVGSRTRATEWQDRSRARAAQHLHAATTAAR
jgi:WD40 repeat protein